MLTPSPEPDPERIFSGFELAGRGHVVAAVSGGGDSLALLFLLKAYLDARADAPAILAVTVDHGLRPEAAAEADDVAALCARHGIAHRTLRWTEHPASGLGAAAREARYRLLAQAADEAGTDIVMTGHTLDDQAETVSMRAERGGNEAASRGEAGMAAATLLDGRIWLLRPLLATRRSDLRTVLARQGIAWSDDPTNDDARHERVRARRRLAEQGDTAIGKLAGKAEAAGRARRELGERAARLIARLASRPAPGLLRLAPEFARNEDREAALYALRILLAVTGGREHLPDADRSMAILDAVAAPPHRATLSRCVVDARRLGIFLHREWRGLPSRLPLANRIWDGRWRLDAKMPQGIEVGPFADASENAAPPAGIPASLVRAALAAEPALWRDGECLGHVSETGAARPVAAPWARFLPGFDLAPAQAAARLIGASIPAQPPFAGHKARYP